MDEMTEFTILHVCLFASNEKKIECTISAVYGIYDIMCMDEYAKRNLFYITRVF